MGLTETTFGEKLVYESDFLPRRTKLHADFGGRIDLFFEGREESGLLES
jgi:hypothetical protein